MSFDAFLETAWNDHADRPDEVAARLASSLGLVTDAAGIAPYARIVAHVYGEHLGRWTDGVALIESLRRSAANDGKPETASALARYAGALLCGAGDDAALAALDRDDRIAALAIASSAFTARSEWSRAIGALDEALKEAEPGIVYGSQAIRPLAVAGNNLAEALESRPDRSANETFSMIGAAQAGLTYWKRAGTWLEEERAFWRLAKSRLAAGDYADAIASARDCLAVCESNDAPAFERFFGYAALAQAQRAAGDTAGAAASARTAVELHSRVPEDERHWCAAELARLSG